MAQKQSGKRATKKRQTKYVTHVMPKLKLIEAWARDGDIEETIAKKLGIAYSTFNLYKSEHLELSEALKKGKEVVDVEVENSLLKKAHGYNAKVVKTFKVKEVYYNDDGRRCESEHLESRYDEVHVPADTTAQIFWLKNRKPDKWRDKRETELSGNVNNPLADFSTEELRELLKK